MDRKNERGAGNFMKLTLGRILLCLLAVQTVISLNQAWAADRPHIVYILANDLGWNDVGYHGGEAFTPRLDALAEAGARLEKFYTLPNSTPTRAALMTGRYPMRFGMQMLSILPWSSYGVPLDERMLPQALKLAGYRTAAFGQWQLGHASRDLLPTQRGFDYFYGSLDNGIDHFQKTNRIGERDWRRGEKPISERGYATTLIARDAAAFIANHDAMQPLFMYVSLPVPAVPLQAPREYLEKYKDVKQADQRTYYAMISAFDAAVGRIVDALKEKGIIDNALLVVHSDNGGAVKNKFPSGDGDVSQSLADNGPFRNGRGSFYEGGIRVVALAVWPGHIKQEFVSERIHVTDMYVTLLNLAGASLDSDSQTKPVDGIDMWPVIAQGKTSPRNEMLINIDEFRGALMVDDWKLIVYAPLPSRIELYNVADDPSEDHNRAGPESDRVQKMLARLNEYAWEMKPSLYLGDLTRARAYDMPMVFGENPQRP
jgi:arylsulfatase A-like enzyme